MNTIRQTIIGDDKVAQLILEIREMPERIRSVQDSLAESEFELAIFNDDKLADERVKEIEQETYFMVLNATEEVPDKKTGELKPVKKYTNDNQREAAKKTLLLKDQDYADALDALLRAKRTKAELKMKVGKLNNMVGSVIGQSFGIRAIAELVSGLCKEDESKLRLDQLLKHKASIDQATQTLADVTREMEVNHV